MRNTNARSKCVECFLLLLFLENEGGFFSQIKLEVGKLDKGHSCLHFPY